MISKVLELSKEIENCINEFWHGITSVNHDNLVISGDNLLMLYLYIMLKAKIPSLFAYVKLMEDFSTPFVSC